MPIRPIRVYADTSVFGGAFDDEFAAPSLAFFEQVRAATRFSLVVSPLIFTELAEAPQHVRDLFESARTRADSVEITEEAVRLQRAYLKADIVAERWRADAMHVALAAIAGCGVIVSWNFKHIVNYRKIGLYNGVNLAHGYGTLGIHTPQEVIDDEDEDQVV